MRLLGPGMRHGTAYWLRAVALAGAAVALAAGVAGCDGSSVAQPRSAPAEAGQLKAIAVESFLADIAGNVARDKLAVEPLMPSETDPHAFELTPADAARVAGCDILILNGADLEPFLEETVEAIGGDTLVIEASAGLTSRAAREGEEAYEPEGGNRHDSGDPHFWLDPTLTIRYVENIRDGLSRGDPANAPSYQANAAAYIESLRALDTWIARQVAAVPPAARLLVTNHESFGYFADRYGFRIVGTIMPSVSAQASPSAQQLTDLIEIIRETGVPAIFLETGSDSRLAEQLSAETGVRVVVDLYSHSLTGAGGPAPTYIDMMKANTAAIVGALGSQ